jgi:hypothetical protein
VKFNYGILQDMFQNNMNKKKMKLTDTIDFISFIRQEAYIISGSLYKNGMSSRQLW